ncbi:DUF5047 domain-containing protein [Streptomyces varsoviensis]|uniref:DUF5047 domain-containing protein n=1 Tax=Streptomyces varsoviensis TaxID=67373 RepID=UPI003405AF83
MHPISDQFRQALTTSHTIVTRVDAYYDGALTASEVPIESGTVTVDRGSKVRRALSLSVSDIRLLPWDVRDPLASYGQQLVVSRGIRFAGGATEMVPLGTFRINEPSGDVYAGPVSVTGQSAECHIQEDKFLAPTSTRGYGTCVEAITFLIRQTLPNAAVVNLTADGRNPVCPVVTWDVNADRWDAVAQVATAMHAEIYVDSLNRFVITDVPNVLTTPVAWEISEGEKGTLVSASRQMPRTNVFNAVMVSSENTTANVAPVSAVAYDNDPNSPTRWGGPFGRVAKAYSSALLTSRTACQTAANYMLADAIAPNIQTSISSIPNPALEGGDCLRVIYANGKKELFTVQSLSIPLTAEGEFPLTLRGGKETTP